jgi:hypothetical protein
MKRYFAPFVLITLLAGTACSPPASIQTPQGKAAYTADQIVIRVNELQAAAIQAEANKGIDTATARIIVQFAVSADKTLKEVPAGWQAAVAKAWAETKAKLPVITNPAVSSAISSVDVVLASFGS